MILPFTFEKKIIFTKTTIKSITNIILGAIYVFENNLSNNCYIT